MNRTYRAVLSTLVLVVLVFTAFVSYMKVDVLAVGDVSPEILEDVNYLVFNDPFYLAGIRPSAGVSSVEHMTDSDGSYLRLHANPVGSDPYIFLPLNFMQNDGIIDCSKYKYLAIRVRTAYAGGGPRIYYDTSDNIGLNEEKAVSFAVTYSGSNQWETVVVDFSTLPLYTGTLTTIRYDMYGIWPTGIEYMDVAWFAFLSNRDDLTKIAVNLDEINNQQSAVYTRRPIVATPDRTRPPWSASTQGSGDEANSSDYSNVITTVVAVLSLICAAVLAVGAIIIQKKR